MIARACFVLVLFGILCAAATTQDEAAQVSHEVRAGTFHFDGANLWRAIRVYFTDALDEERYLAYADALLGRPYAAWFVRSREGWRTDRAVDAGLTEESPRVSSAHALVPYRDFSVEYPPGFFLWTLPPALLTADRDHYLTLFTFFMALLMSASLWLTHRLARDPDLERARGDRLIAWTAGAALALGVVVTHRYDAAVALLLCVVAWSALTARPIVLGISLGLVLASKGVPILVAPPVALWWLRHRPRRKLAIAVAAASATVLVIVTPFFLVAGRAMLDVVTYHAQRPLQVESTAAALCVLLARHGLTSAHGFGSINLMGPAADFASSVTSISSVLFVLIAWIVGARLTRRDRPSALIVAMLLPLAAFMTTAKVFSPQYLVWLLPLGLLVSLSRRGPSAPLFVTACAVAQVVYPALIPALEQIDPRAYALVLLRNGLVAAWSLSLLLPPSH